MTDPPPESPFAGVPAAVLALAPEAAECGPGEARATCSRCPLAAEAAPWPWSFAPDARCCTFSPSLASFYVGRALAAGGDSARLIRAHLATRLSGRRGPSPRGIPAPSPPRASDFGRSAEDRCPYWLGGDHACGIWADRPAVCRTWFCKHDDGLGGAVEWTALGALVGEAEELVAGALVELAVARGVALPAHDDDLATWEAWFRWCADHVDAVSVEPDEALDSRRRDLATYRARPRRTLSARLTPSVRQIWRGEARVLIAGYSCADAVEAPPEVFSLLSLLDGSRTWPEALRECAAPALDAGLVAELHRVGAIGAADGSDELPFRVDVEPATPRT